MSNPNLKQIKCPTCGKANTWADSNNFRPFCSERCKLIDLGEWASEKYRVAHEKVNPEDISKDDNDNEKE